MNRIYKEETIQSIEEIIEGVPDHEINKKVRQAGFCRQFLLLSKRGLRRFVRNEVSFKMKIAEIIFLIVIYCFLYFDLDDIDPEKPITINNRLGGLFFLYLNIFLIFFDSSVSLCKLTSSRRKRGFPEGIRFWIV